MKPKDLIDTQVMEVLSLSNPSSPSNFVFRQMPQSPDLSRIILQLVKLLTACFIRRILGLGVVLTESYNLGHNSHCFGKDHGH